jgi:anti-sigma factor RsiW
MDSKTEDDLLLYWSGEADSKLSAEIEALSEKDPAAQRYLGELDKLNVLRDELVDLPMMNSSRSFALEAVTERLVERKVTRFPLPWIAAAAAAAVIAVIAVGIKSWLHEGTSQVEEVVVKEKESSNEPATRAKLSKRLFSTRPQDPALERISIARDRARKLRTELNHLPTS